ncbi:MAG: type II 3-dehydroquinate dehydratase [Patescibacteria group bacterium]
MKKRIERSMVGIIFLINGPNLNLLGKRDPEKYGTATLEQITRQVAKKARKHGFVVKAFQSNHSGALIDFIQTLGLSEATVLMRGIVLNAGGLTHTDVSLRDAVDFASSKGVPTVEVHLSNIHKRETFRQVSLLTGVSIDQVCGLGARSYTEGLEKLITHLKEMRRKSKKK